MKTKLRFLLIVLTMLGGVPPARAQLDIAPSGRSSVLSWPKTATNYVLQSTTDLAVPNWATVSNLVPVIVGNSLTVTVTNAALAKFFRLYDANPPVTFTADGMALIPAGVFTMGDTLDGDANAVPTNTAVSAFYMDTNLVSITQWQAVSSYATSHGYGFVNVGSGKASNHPVQTVDWYDAVKWSNARSQQTGLTPVYYTDAGLTHVYTSGETTNIFANWSASGYRLPTEAEWEKAARGGFNGQRFPWGVNISESLANYFSAPNGFIYDLGPANFNAAFYTGSQPYTSPVGYFARNGYGLYDMAGNVSEWCWDWYGTPYAGGTDPRGPSSSPNGYRVHRGGDWIAFAYSARCACRDGNLPTDVFFFIGFRCVRGL